MFLKRILLIFCILYVPYVACSDLIVERRPWGTKPSFDPFGEILCFQHGQEESVRARVRTLDRITLPGRIQSLPSVLQNHIASFLPTSYEVIPYKVGVKHFHASVYDRPHITWEKFSADLSSAIQQIRNIECLGDAKIFRVIQGTRSFLALRVIPNSDPLARVARKIRVDCDEQGNIVNQTKLYENLNCLMVLKSCTSSDGTKIVCIDEQEDGNKRLMIIDTRTAARQYIPRSDMPNMFFLYDNVLHISAQDREKRCFVHFISWSDVLKKKQENAKQAIEQKAKTE